MNRKVLGFAAAAALAFSTAAYAQTNATATTDLNIRSGPGSNYTVVGVVGANQPVTVNGCLDGSKWCSVDNNGAVGWVYSDYLTSEFTPGKRITLTERPKDAIRVVRQDDSGTAGGALIGGATGVVAGALIGGPVGAAVGGVVGVAAGGTAGAAIDPPSEVRTYIASNQLEPVYLEGEVVVGAGLPENVEIQEIPNFDYRYANINGQPVLVDQKSRQIVYVLRQ